MITSWGGGICVSPAPETSVPPILMHRNRTHRGASPRVARGADRVPGASFDFILTIAESRGINAMQIKIDLPADVFDAQFPEDQFRARVRELAILDLVRSKRLHEHEALEMLGIDRRELIDKMKEQGFAPTEDLFNEIRGALDKAIAARRNRAANGGKKRR
jgi:hypothetical protein